MANLGYRKILTNIISTFSSSGMLDRFDTMIENIHKGLIGVRKDHRYSGGIGFYRHNPAGTKLLKKIGMYQDNDGNWCRSETGGTLTMCNPGGVVSQTFRDIAQTRNKMKRM